MTRPANAERAERPGTESSVRPSRRQRTLPRPCRVFGVSYGSYVQIRDDPRNDGLRLTYFDGVLEIMSPEYTHERGSEGLGLIVRIVAEVFSIDCDGSGSTTFRRGELAEPKGHGKEPDRSFYCANGPAIRGKATIDLEVDPPPDLWIEVDNRSSSRGQLPLYAAPGIPEVWQYRVLRRTLRFFRLNDAGDGYESIERSRCLPMLKPDAVLDALEQGTGRSDTQWLRWLREWAAALPNP